MTQSLQRTRSGAVVSSDLSAYEQIKRERVRQQQERSMRDDIDELRAMVVSLKAEVEGLKRG